MTTNDTTPLYAQAVRREIHFPPDLAARVQAIADEVYGGDFGAFVVLAVKRAVGGEKVERITERSGG